jgi:signal transduction histidine kinase
MSSLLAVPNPLRNAEGEGPARIGSLVTNDACISADKEVRSLIALFDARPDLDSVGVIDGTRIGMVSRSRFFLQLGHRFGYALFENRPVRLLMEEASTVDADQDPVEVIALATQREPYRLYDDILVLKDGVFRGLVSMRSLMAHHKDLLFASFDEVTALNARNRHLEEVNHMQSEFVANMTHELRTPLNTLLGVTEIMRRDPGFPAHHVRNLDRMRSRSLDLLEIVNNLLDISGLQAGGMKPIAEDFDLVSFLEETVASAEALAAGRPIHVLLDLGRLPTSFVSDPVLLRRILGNLMSNAVKFTEQGKVTLSASSDQGRLVLEVRDTGVGISSADCQRLFSRFTQLESTRSKRHAGTGLGLAIVKGFVQQLGGQVFVESTPGQGSTFTVCLPSLAAELEIR